MINEALAEEVQRGEQRKERSNRVTTAAPAPTLASPARDSRENPIESEPNPKSRWLVNSASSAASGGMQQHVKRSATDAEPEATLEICWKLALVKAQCCPERRQHSPDEELL